MLVLLICQVYYAFGVLLILIVWFTFCLLMRGVCCFGLDYCVLGVDLFKWLLFGFSLVVCLWLIVWVFWLWLLFCLVLWGAALCVACWFDVAFVFICLVCLFVLFGCCCYLMWLFVSIGVWLIVLVLLLNMICFNVGWCCVWFGCFDVVLCLFYCFAFPLVSDCKFGFATGYICNSVVNIKVSIVFYMYGAFMFVILTLLLIYCDYACVNRDYYLCLLLI